MPDTDAIDVAPAPAVADVPAALHGPTGGRRGAHFALAVSAVAAALLPSVLTLGLWLAHRDPAPVVYEFDDGESLFSVYIASQLDPDECKADFAETVGVPSSERLPRYFC